MILFYTTLYFLVIFLMAFLSMLFYRLYKETQSVRNSLYGVYLFPSVVIKTPMKQADEVYSKRKKIIKHLHKDNVSPEFKSHVTELVNSKKKLYIFFYRDFIWTFPNSVETYVEAYDEFNTEVLLKRKKRNKEKNKKNNKVRLAELITKEFRPEIVDKLIKHHA
ncbi:hypothetical protein [Terribacillus saccharophilus]|uniref:hypothetical protein n=1 Tax=Terribacillus saccharophilus TaxID=361277 RepID=UPI003981C40C